MIRLLVVGAVLALSSCKAQPGIEPQAVDLSAAQVTEHVFRPYDSNAPQKEIGESCDVSGGTECRSGVCLKTGIESRTAGHVCSQQCSDGVCPQGWSCSQLYPAPGNDFCVPDTGQRFAPDVRAETSKEGEAP